MCVVETVIPLKKRYEALTEMEKIQFVQDLGELTNQSESLIEKWISGHAVPSLIDQKDIAILLGVKRSEIFQ